MVKKGKAITDGEAQNVSGGYVHNLVEFEGYGTQGWMTSKWVVINDRTGEIMSGKYDTKEEAQTVADKLGQKTDVISDKDYCKMVNNKRRDRRAYGQIV